MLQLGAHGGGLGVAQLLQLMIRHPQDVLEYEPLDSLFGIVANKLDNYKIILMMMIRDSFVNSYAPSLAASTAAW